MEAVHRKRRLWVFVAAVLIIASACSPEDGSEPGAEGAATATPVVEQPVSGESSGAVAEAGASWAVIPEVAAQLAPSVVAVLTPGGEGSGVVWNDDGIIVTNAHVVGPHDEAVVAFADGKRSPARVVAVDTVVDLAVLDAERDDLPAATFADALPVVGELAIAVGNPLGFENTVTAGVISGVQRAIPGSATQTQSLVDLIQTDAAISPGNSGGALVNGSGEVVGINVAYIPPQARAVSLASPSHRRPWWTLSPSCSKMERRPMPSSASNRRPSPNPSPSTWGSNDGRASSSSTSPRVDPPPRPGWSPATSSSASVDPTSTPWRSSWANSGAWNRANR